MGMFDNVFNSETTLVKMLFFENTFFTIFNSEHIFRNKNSHIFSC